MTTTPGPAIEPEIDENPDLGNAAGGADAVEEPTPPEPLTPEVPRSAQMDHEDIPDELKEPEGPDSEANIDDPSAEPSA
jgi:hypothetical protein